MSNHLNHKYRRHVRQSSHLYLIIAYFHKFTTCKYGQLHTPLYIPAPERHTLYLSITTQQQQTTSQGERARARSRLHTALTYHRPIIVSIMDRSAITNRLPLRSINQRSQCSPLDNIARVPSPGKESLGRIFCASRRNELTWARTPDHTSHLAHKLSRDMGHIA